MSLAVPASARYTPPMTRFRWGQFGLEPLDRADHLRTDQAALAALWPRARYVAFWRGKPLITAAEGAPRLVFLDAGAVVGEPVLLGLDEGVAYAAMELPGDVEPVLPDGAIPADIRLNAAGLDERDAALAALGRALLSWQRAHRFCGQCGARHAIVDAGWKAICTSCAREAHPRVDPVVILQIRHGDGILLGRSPGWPQGMYSCLAGFVEPAETLEAAAAREAMEEAGVVLRDVTYLGCQPWPFPGQLMVAMRGEAECRRLKLNAHELEEAHWFARADCQLMLEGRHPRVSIPPRAAIAHAMIAHFAASEEE